MSYRLQKVNEELKKALSALIFDQFAEANITVTCVDTVADLSFAKVYVRSISAETDKMIEELNLHAAEWRSEIFRKMTIKKVPKLEFMIDEVGKEEERINKLINAVNKKRNGS